MADKPARDVNVNAVPQNLEAEQCLLGCILLDDNLAQELVPTLKAEDFYAPSHRILLSAMQKVLNESKPIDFVTVADALDRSGQLAAAGGINYLTTLNTVVPSSANYRVYLKIVERNSVLRALIRAGTSIIEECRNSDDEERSVAFAEKAVYDISDKKQSGDLTPVGESTGEVLTIFDELYKNQGAFKGIPTGFMLFDSKTNGLHGGDLIVLAARPGCGKSSLALNMVESAAKNRKSCAIFSLEMPKVQLAQRLLCSMASVSMTRAKTGKLTSRDFAELWKANEAISRMKIFIDDSSLITPAQILSKCRRLKNREGLDFIVIDYIQLMEGGDRSENRQQEISKITRTLKIIAKELDVPILALSQMSRLVERRDDKEPQLSDLRESGAIEQDADMVLFINKNKEAEGEAVQPVELIIAKHRNGETGKLTLNWIGEYVRFTDPDTFVRTEDGRETSEENARREQRDLERLAADAPLPDFDDAPPEEADGLSETDFND